MRLCDGGCGRERQIDYYCLECLASIPPPLLAAMIHHETELRVHTPTTQLIVNYAAARAVTMRYLRGWYRTPAA